MCVFVCYTDCCFSSSQAFAFAAVVAERSNSYGVRIRSRSILAKSLERFTHIIVVVFYIFDTAASLLLVLSSVPVITANKA